MNERKKEKTKKEEIEDEERKSKTLHGQTDTQ